MRTRRTTRAHHRLVRTSVIGEGVEYVFSQQRKYWRAHHRTSLWRPSLPPGSSTLRRLRKSPALLFGSSHTFATRTSPDKFTMWRTGATADVGLDG